ncbi:MAG: MFS transporter [Clostridia bacterium]|nr:MFS transporter [Clostridia bacterium]
MDKSARRVKLACYSTNVSMSIVGNLSPLLFITFHNMYDISYTLLGMLVLINFLTQLCVDLCFSFFSDKINLAMAARITPALTVAGLLLFAAAPMLFPGAVYVGLVLGTVVFSAASGFAEVLISPIIAALPAKNPEREMSKLHSVYAWGVVGAVIFSTLFLLIFGSDKWQLLAIIFTVVPAIGFVLFIGAKLPPLEGHGKGDSGISAIKSRELWLCVLAIFLGGAAECTMAQWASGYLEAALGIEKTWGDIFGVAMFAVMLGLGRSLYAKIGKNVEKVIFLGAVGATLCYLTAALTPWSILGLIACGLTGICVSMMWPGCLVISSERLPGAGVFVYAMMAAGGDLGASIGPQLVGITTDGITASALGTELAARLGMSAEALGMKAGMLVGMLFPLLAIGVYLYLYKTKAKSRDAIDIDSSLSK